MKTTNRKSGLRTAWMVIALCGAAAAQAASGFNVTAHQEASIKIGMSQDEVCRELGRPAHDVKYRNEPGRTWTYRDLDHTDTVFDIHFSPEGRVLSSIKRVVPID